MKNKLNDRRRVTLVSRQAHFARMAELCATLMISVSETHLAET
jgi:hypothetical protein